MSPGASTAVNPTSETTAPSAAVSVNGLVKRYDQLEAVRGIDFEVATGEIFGFLGPNGAGKSTTISMLCTLVRPSGGSALVAGHDIVSERDDVRRNIGLVFQETTLDGYLSAEQNLRLHAELYGVPRGLVSDRMRQVMEMVGLWERRESLANTFSGGMKRRLEIARGLFHSPRVLFLDEPTVGLDPQTRSSIWGYIRELKAQRGHHDLPHDPLHGRGRVLRPHRDHGSGPHHRARLARGAEGERRQGPRADPHRRRPGGDRGAARRASAIEATIVEGAVTFGVSEGEHFVPRLFAELDVPIRTVSVARPSLDDVFMSYTGSTIRDADSTSTDKMRDAARMMRS